MPRRPCGFTLLEVLVALAILATALYAATGSVRSAARQEAHRETSVLAHWAAMNLATELSLTSFESDAVQATRPVNLYGHAFIAAIEPQRDEADKVVSLTIDVALASAPAARVHSLTIPAP